jgi:hypothetical protein
MSVHIGGIHQTQQETQMTTRKRITRVLTVALVAMGIVGLTVGSASAASITIVNGDFQAPLFDEDGAGGLAAWYWVPDWEEGGSSYYGSGAGGFLYCDAGGFVYQDLSYNWTAGEVFTLGVRGNQGWRAGGSFKIQLLEADTTLLWESATMPVTSTDSNFSWTVDSSTDFLAGTPGSQLRIRIECLAATVYLDDVMLSTDFSDTLAPTVSDIVDDRSGGPVNQGELVTYTVTFSEAMDDGTLSTNDFDNAGTAGTSFGTITSGGGYSYIIPVLTLSGGTLQLRIPTTATLTDLVGNALDTSSAILDDDTITVDSDTTAPTLSDVLDDKSGGPVNVSELVTYTVTFSEAIIDGTVSVSDFDNAGSAAIVFGTITPSGAGVYSIPVVASSTGTLQLRIPVGATLTDLAGNPLDTSSAILDDNTINVEASPIAVTGGDFESPTLPAQAQPGDIPLWFDNTGSYNDWHNSTGYTSSGSQSAFLNSQTSPGYMYQSLGQLTAGVTSLDWSFDQVRYALSLGAAGTGDMRFFYGVGGGAGEGVDIDTLGLTQIGSTVSIPTPSGTSDAVRSGSVDVSSVPAGSTIWIDFTHTSGYFLLDNIDVTAIVPSVGVVLIIE